MKYHIVKVPRKINGRLSRKPWHVIDENGKYFFACKTEESANTICAKLNSPGPTIAGPCVVRQVAK
jgi:hypothetical protein